MSESLTLWEIHQGIADTCEALECAQRAVEFGMPEQIPEVERLQEVLRAYVRAEVGKVDRIRGYIKHGEMMAAAARAEAKAQSERAQAWVNRLKWLKSLVMAVIQETPGRKKVEGPTGWMRVQTNGGKPALEIAQPHLVPDEYRTAQVTLTAQELEILHEYALCIDGFDGLHLNLDIARKAAEPNPTKIRLALARGEKIPGCALAPLGEHLRVS